MPSIATEIKTFLPFDRQMTGQTLRAGGADDVAPFGPVFRKLRFHLIANSQRPELPISPLEIKMEVTA